MAPKHSSSLVDIDELRHVSSAGSRPLTERIALLRLWWLRHVLHVSVHRLSFRPLFARVAYGWTKRSDGQTMN